MFLNKIETPCLVEFFKSRFADTGKSIDDEASHLIAKLVDNHPYYAQQLAQFSWLRTKDICTVEIVHEAHTALVEQLSLLFVTITETLTTQQWTISKFLLPAKRPSVRPKWCIAIKSLQRPQYPAQRQPLSRMIYWWDHVPGPDLCLLVEDWVLRKIIRLWISATVLGLLSPIEKA